MNRLLIGMILSTFILTTGFCNATVESWDPGTGTGTIGPGGCVDS